MSMIDPRRLNIGKIARQGINSNTLEGSVTMEELTRIKQSLTKSSGRMSEEEFVTGISRLRAD